MDNVGSATSANMDNVGSATSANMDNVGSATSANMDNVGNIASVNVYGCWCAKTSCPMTPLQHVYTNRQEKVGHGIAIWMTQYYKSAQKSKTIHKHDNTFVTITTIHHKTTQYNTMCHRVVVTRPYLPQENEQCQEHLL